jgi:exodeoxyribonuclease-3
MRIATWNVNGIRARYPEALELVRREEPAVLCLQEIKASPEQAPGVLVDLPHYWHYWHGAPGGYSGVSLHLRRDAFEGTTPVFSHPDFDHETRIVEARCGDLVFASVYVPNGNKNYEAKVTFLKAMAGYVEAVHRTGATLVLCGDLNVAHRPMDVHPGQRKAVIGQLPEERALFDDLLARGLVDVSRRLAPEDDRLFTWWPYWRQAREKNVGWRLDYVLVSEPVAQRPMTSRILREHGTSDHGPLVVDLDLS